MEQQDQKQPETNQNQPEQKQNPQKQEQGQEAEQVQVQELGLEPERQVFAVPTKRRIRVIMSTFPVYDGVRDNVIISIMPSNCIGTKRVVYRLAKTPTNEIHVHNAVKLDHLTASKNSRSVRIRILPPFGAAIRSNIIKTVALVKYRNKMDNNIKLRITASFSIALLQEELRISNEMIENLRQRIQSGYAIIIIEQLKTMLQENTKK